MGTRRLLRNVLALAAAYAMALQSILLGLAASARAHAGPPGLLCVSEESYRPPSAPVRERPVHDGVCCLAMGCGGNACVAPASAGEQPAHDGQLFSARLIVAYQTPDAWPNERPRSSRAPPA